MNMNVLWRIFFLTVAVLLSAEIVAYLRAVGW
jgi:hypothetical protein